jgi:hypothetical protein
MRGEDVMIVGETTQLPKPPEKLAARFYNDWISHFWPAMWYELWCKRSEVFVEEGGMTRTQAELEAAEEICRVVERGFLNF